MSDGRCKECRDATAIPVADSHEDIDWSKTAGGRIPSSLSERQQWMGAIVGDDGHKLPFAPWGDRDHPDGDDDTDSRFQWGISDNYVSGTKVEDELERSSEIQDLAFIQQEDDPHAHVDFDDVVDPEIGETHPAVSKILNQLGFTFVEVSQSGNGIHASYYGVLPDGVKQAEWDLDDEPFGANDDLPSIEIYDGKRQLLVTGEHVRGTPAAVRSWDDSGLRELLEDHDQFPDTVSTPSEKYDDFDVDDYEPDVAGSGETDDIHDVFAAVNQLNYQHVAERTIVDSWNDSASTSEGARAFHPTWSPNNNGTANIITDTGWDYTGGRSYGGAVTMALLDMGEVDPKNITQSEVRGSLWFKGVDHLRDLGFEIPELVDFPDGGDDSTNPIPEPRQCDPPELKERVPFDAEKERQQLEDEEYGAFIDATGPVVWTQPCGWGKTTSSIRGADKRDRRAGTAFPTHKKAHESITDPNTPDDIFHLKGPTWPKNLTCLEAKANNRQCPEHGDEQCPLMCSLFERDADDPLRQEFERLKEIYGAVSAHYHFDPHNGEQCEWSTQFDELASQTHVACVQEHQTLKKLREDRDILIDESSRLMKHKEGASVEELLNGADVLEAINGVDRNYGELATFARRLAEGIRVGDGSDVEPPSIEWTSETDVMKAETLAAIRIKFNEHLRSQVEKGHDSPVKPGVIDVIIGFAAQCGLDTDACAKALGGAKALGSCPWCDSRLSNQNGRRVCVNEDCGWVEGTDTYLPPDAEKARFIAIKRNGVSGQSEAAVITIPNLSDLPNSPLILDATATPKKVEGLYGREPTVVGDDHNVQMNMRVTQITDGAYHGSAFDNPNLIKRFQTFIDWVCKEYDNPLFGAKKDILKRFEFADNAVTEHYGGLRGLNHDDCDVVIALGAPHWHIDDLERDAELLSGGIAIDNGLEVGGVEYSLRRENGELVANPPTYRRLQYVDDDERGLEFPVKEFSGLVGDLFYEKRENELEQLVHRTRPITSDTPIDVYLLTNVVTDLPVDEVSELDTLVGQAKGRSETVTQLDVPDGAKDLVESLDPSETFTRNDLKDRSEVGGRTVENWVSSLIDMGIIEPTGETKLRSEVLTIAE
ncbi:hypothetical protein [Halococcus sp. IIIV-5B]|uniref:hypothetical protein n=1 Tax=Halococcus sp. IIIV-5B TaxID=2321230 RepID=UPI0011C395AE|nr:hypothetical protein [Halococcus sp. IIIV-5B]